MPQVTIGLKAISLGGLDQSEKGDTICGTLRAAGKQPVLSANNKWADGIFDKVVVRTQPSVFYVDDQLFPIRQNGLTVPHRRTAFLLKMSKKLTCALVVKSLMST